MGIEAIAVLHVPIDVLRTALHAVAGEPGTFRGLAGQRLELREADDATLVYTHAPFSAEPEELGTVLRFSLGALLDEHEDDRGVFVFPSVARPGPGGYESILEQMGEAGFWIPEEALADVPDEEDEAGDGATGGLEAAMSGLMGALPPGALAGMQQMLAQTDPATLAQAAQQLQGALAGSNGDMMSVLQRTMAQARDMLLAGEPEPADGSAPRLVPGVGPAAAQPAPDGKTTPSPDAEAGGGAGPSGLPAFVPDPSQAPELWRQAQAHVEAMRESNPEQWQKFEQQLGRLVGGAAEPGANEPDGSAARPPGAPPAKQASAKGPSTGKKRRRRR